MATPPRPLTYWQIYDALLVIGPDALNGFSRDRTGSEPEDKCPISDWLEERLKARVAQGKLDFAVGAWAVHAAMVLLLVVLFAQRMQLIRLRFAR